MRDHRGNGKIERLIRTINERLRTNRQIIITKDQSGLSEILYALRVNKKKDGSSPFEKQMGRQPNTVKSKLVSKLLAISEQDPNLEFEQSDFQDDLDSTVLVRDRARGSKLQGSFEKRSGEENQRDSPHRDYVTRVIKEAQNMQNVTLRSRQQSRKKRSGGRKLRRRKGPCQQQQSDNSDNMIQRKKVQKKNKTGTSQVGAISKAQKAQNFFGKKLEIFEKKILSEKVTQCQKM